MKGYFFSFFMIIALKSAWSFQFCDQKREEATLSPPLKVRGYDTPNDGGGSITIEWESSKHDKGKAEIKYSICRSTNPRHGFKEIGLVYSGTQKYVDNETKDGEKYYYKIIAVSKGKIGISEVSKPVTSRPQWFDTKKLNLAIIAFILSFFVIYFIRTAIRGKKLFIRKIAGIDAIEEAIGRATEMGKPILFIPGIADMDNVQTVAGVIILGRIAKTIAEYDIKLNVPVSRSIVMSTARETIKEAYLAAGRPEAYSEDMVHYLTDAQFAYVAGVNGIMVREKPATCFYMGCFFAESLILAETGNSINAIQIAGTAMPSQLPFFIAACDYTLIGEELFAASAYLSNEPRQLGSLKGQDVGKFIAMGFIAIGTIITTLNNLIPNRFINFLWKLVSKLFET
jgi:hypothetical protein